MAAGGQPGELRIGLTIAGAVALGAFEGGALAALMHAVGATNRRRPDALRVDAIAGASAGSMTAVVAARTLLAGLDPIDAMWEAWVTTPALSRLRDGLKAPLTLAGTEAAARHLLTMAGGVPLQTAPVRVNLALGSLRRLDYEIGRIGGAPVRATTYLDWQRITFTTQTPGDAYIAAGNAMDAALASGSHGVAFRPRGLDRSADAIQQAYRRHRIDFPPQFAWYTDGGTIDNQPLGRALELTVALDGSPDDPRGGARRLHLLITPDPPLRQAPTDRWTDPDHQPRWLGTGERLVPLLFNQHLYDDLRRVEKTNSRIAWTRELETALGAIVDGTAPDPEAALRDVIASIERQKRQLYDDDGGAPPADRAPSSEAGTLLRHALELATGFGEKDYVALAMVSPMNLPNVADGSKVPADVLAGRFLMAFGGFLNQALRENDFAVGYDSMRAWMAGDDGLAARGLDTELATAALHDVDAARAARAWRTDVGGMTLKARPLREKLAVLRLAARSAAIVVNDVLRSKG